MGTNTKDLPDIKGTDTIASSWRRLLERDRNISNFFSGDAFTTEQDPVIDKGKPNWRTDLRRLFIYEGNTIDGDPIFTDLLSLLEAKDLPYEIDSAYAPEDVNNVKAALDFIVKRNLLNEITLPSESKIFVGTGNTFKYPLETTIGNKSSLYIFIDGVKQAPNTYELVNEGTEVEFKLAPAYGETIEILINASLLQYDYSPIITYATGDGVTTEFPLGFEALNKATLSVNINNRELQKEQFELLDDKKTVKFYTVAPEGSRIQFTTTGRTSFVTASPSSIGTDELKDNSVTTQKLSSDLDLSGNVIKDGTLSGNKLPTGAITEVKLADGAVTNSKIINGGVTKEKLSASVQNALLSVGNVSSTNLADKSVTLAKLSDEVIAKLDKDTIITDILNRLTILENK